MPEVKRAMTWNAHVAKWGHCERCDLCQGRKRVCLARGNIPADVLFLGEAPGASEDVLGSPFVGPAGQLLDDWVADSGMGQWACCFTNLTACIPLGEDGNKTAEPSPESIMACQPRLKELITMCQRGSPDCAGLQLVVCVGTLASKWATSYRIELGLTATKLLDIVHPAATMRAPVAQKSLLMQRNMVALRNAAAEMIPF